MRLPLPHWSWLSGITHQSMPLITFDPSSQSHISSLVDIWNAACGADLAINMRFAQYNTRPVTGAIQAGRLAKRGDRLVGFVLASALPNDPLTSPPEIGWIDAIAVIPEFQRRRAGSELLQWAEEWLSSQGCALARLGGSLRPFAPGYPVELRNLAFFKTRGYLERPSSPIFWDVACDLGSTIFAKDPKANQGFVRAAQPNDYDSLSKFLRREFPDRWRFQFEQSSRGQGRLSDYILLLSKRGVDGFARIGFEDSDSPIERVYPYRLPRPWGQLGPIGISADKRGRGWGTMLLNAALIEMKSRGVRGCVIDWTVLLDFYRKFGFEPYRQYFVTSKSLPVGPRRQPDPERA
jgi:GNAT superfamily N-acetyltransferase